MCKIFLKNKKLYEEKIKRLLIDSFWMHKKFHQRVNFVKMCKVFLNNKTLYEEKIKMVLLKLIKRFFNSNYI